MFRCTVKQNIELNFTRKSFFGSTFQVLRIIGLENHQTTENTLRFVNESFHYAKHHFLSSFYISSICSNSNFFIGPIHLDDEMC